VGFSDADLMSRPFLDFVHENDRAPTVKAMAVLKAGQPVVRFRNRYRTVAGHYLKFEWTAKSITAENVIFAVARNLSESIEHHK
jgi:hypothetical protein